MQIDMKMDSKDTLEKKERRNSSRIDLIKRVSYRSSGLTSIECFTQNISEGGLCLFMDEELSLGKMIQTEFFLPGKEPKLIKTCAVVVWQKDYLTGVKFVI